MSLDTPATFHATFFVGSQPTYTNGGVYMTRSQLHHVMTSGWKEEVTYCKSTHNMTEKHMMDDHGTFPEREELTGTEVVREAITIPIDFNQKLEISRLFRIGMFQDLL